MQGVGETLRGSINNEVDSRFPRHNADKAAQADAKNQATLNAGQREMAGLRERNALQPTVSPDYNKNLPYLPHQPSGTYHPNAPVQSASPPAPSTTPRKMKGQYIPPSGSAVEGDMHYTALPNMPAYHPREEDHPAYRGVQPAPTPASVASSEEPSEKRGFRRLIKRRPVPTQ